MEAFSTVRDIIAAWPTRRELACDVGTTTDRVHKWAQTGSIPPRFHAPILRAAERRSIPLTAEALVRAHDRPEAAA